MKPAAARPARDRLNGEETDAACDDFRGLLPPPATSTTTSLRQLVLISLLIVSRGLFKPL